MPSFYERHIKIISDSQNLDKSAYNSVVYHDIFDYPLTPFELSRWASGKKVVIKSPKVEIESKKGFLFLQGKEGLILKRLLRKRASKRKMEIARRAVAIISFVPWVKMVAISGALAMENAPDDADIDLLIISQKGRLWTSRFFTLVILKLFGVPLRRFGDKDQRDKICPNMWLNESSLTWPKKDRNPYTAHEIAQIKPLLNRDKTYELFLYKNSWIKKYWPNAVKNFPDFPKRKRAKERFFSKIFESIFFAVQYKYMKKKITREVVKKGKALFHPHNWGDVVLKRLAQ